MFTICVETLDRKGFRKSCTSPELFQGPSCEQIKLNFVFFWQDTQKHAVMLNYGFC